MYDNVIKYIIRFYIIILLREWFIFQYRYRSIWPVIIEVSTFDEPSFGAPIVKFQVVRIPIPAVPSTVAIEFSRPYANTKQNKINPIFRYISPVLYTQSLYDGGRYGYEW